MTGELIMTGACHRLQGSGMPLLMEMHIHNSYEIDDCKQLEITNANNLRYGGKVEFSYDKESFPLLRSTMRLGSNILLTRLRSN